MSTPATPERWVAKVRYTHPAVIGTIEHVIGTGTKEACQKVVDTYNTRYQTDDAIIEPWDPNRKFLT